MADFPSKVTTETGSPQSQSSQQGGNSFGNMVADITVMMDASFIQSIPAFLMIAEIVLGLLQWALIASAPYTLYPTYGWVMFVAVTLWILTIVLFFVILFRTQRQLTAVSWPLTVMVYHCIATVLYLTAFLANAATVHKFTLIFHGYYIGHLGAAAFFGALVTIAHGASAFFSFMDWKGDRGNAATATVPT